MSDHIDRLRTEGYIVIPDIIPKDEMPRIRASVQASTNANATPDALNKGIGHVGGFMRFDQSMAPYLADPRLIGPIQELLGPQIKVSFTTATINLAGNPRGTWHADWPFNQERAGHVAAPYPDLPVHVTTLWMLSAFSAENGGTLIVPGSHRQQNNPTGNNGVNPAAPHPDEVNASGDEGSVLVMDSRLWHSTAPNRTDQSRVSVVVRYAPWWLNTQVLMPNSEERRMLIEQTGLDDNLQPSVPRDVYDSLPNDVRPLFSHLLED
jgi:hypothetical protein